MKSNRSLSLLCLLGGLIVPVAGPAAVPVAAAPGQAPAPAASKAPAPAAGKAPASPYLARFQQVDQKIASLFAHRNETPPPPNPRHNPFRTPGSAQAAPPRVGESGANGKPPAKVDASDAGAAATGSLDLLQQGAATLKISGASFEIGGVSYLLINDKPYKAGDVVKTQVRGEAVLLRVKEFGKRSVTLALDEAEMTLKF
jgi:hypothetical protein